MEVSLHGARLPARPSQLPDWYSSGVRAGLFLHRVNPLHLEGYVTAIRPTTPLLVGNQWAYTPWVHISSTAVCMVGEPPLKTRKLYTLKQGSEPVQGTKTKTGNERNFDRNRTRTRNEIKFYSSEQNQKIEMAINRLITLFYRSI